MADNTRTLFEFLLAGAKKPDGTPLSYGIIKFFEAGSTTPKNVYYETGEGFDVVTSTVLDAAGVAVWFGQGLYKVIICDEIGSVIQTIDGVRVGRDYSEPIVDPSAVPLFLAGIPGEDGKLLTEGRVYSNDLGSRYITSASDATWVETTVSTDYDLEIYDKENTMIRKIPHFNMGTTHTEVGSTVFSSTPELLPEGLAGFRKPDGYLNCAGFLTWIETSGIASATGLFRDPQMTQKHPAKIMLGSRGEVVAYAIGTFDFVVSDSQDQAIHSYSKTLGRNLSVQISATPETIDEGDTSTLLWYSTGTTDVEIDNGIGRVSPNGTLVVSPTVDTTYVITADTVTDSVAVIVTPAPPPAGHKFFRLIFEHLTTEAVNQYISVDTIKLKNAIGTVTPLGMNDTGADTGPGVPHVEDGWTITASNEHPAYPGWCCFNSVIANKSWMTPNNTTTLPITFDMSSSSSYTLTAYEITRDQYATSRSPKTWTLYGSATGAFAGEEVLLHTVTDFVWTSNVNEWTL